jgi:hypothetical protein
MNILSFKSAPVLALIVCAKVFFVIENTAVFVVKYSANLTGESLGSSFECDRAPMTTDSELNSTNEIGFTFPVHNSNIRFREVWIINLDGVERPISTVSLITIYSMYFLVVTICRLARSTYYS